MTLDVEHVVNGGVNGREALGCNPKGDFANAASYARAVVSVDANSRPDCSVCLGKAHRSPRWEIRAGKLSLQPEAIGADQEATNDLKHFDRKAP